MISFILIFLAGCLNAIMDTLRNTFSSSSISTWNAQFWDASISWKNKYINQDPSQGRTYWLIFGLHVQKPVVVTDGWHLLKTIYLYTIVTAISISILQPVILFPNYPLSNFFTEFILYRTLFGLGFTLFYNIVLKSK